MLADGGQLIVAYTLVLGDGDNQLVFAYTLVLGDGDNWYLRIH